jgi:hypothetical protein
VSFAMVEKDDTGIIIDKIGINVRRHKELIHRLFELVESSGIGPSLSTSQLIDMIADEPTFTKKECVYLGLYLATMHQDDANTPASS